MTSGGNYRRLQKRLSRDALLLAVSAGAFVAVVALGEQDNLLANVSLATAYASVVLLIIALSLGPIRVLRKKPARGSNDLRRDAGIGAGVLAIVHTVLGLQVHFQGRMWAYFVFPDANGAPLGIRYDAFGLANFAGLLACALFVLLLYWSNDRALRRLGRVRWKARQRYAYWTAGLVLAHGVVYQQLESRSAWLVLALLASFGLGVVLQAAGVRAWRRRQKNRIGQ